MTCKKFVERLEDFVAGHLDENASEAMRVHMHGCPDCAAEHEQRLRLRRQMRELLDVKPPSELKDTILRAAAGHEAILDDRDWRDDFDDADDFIEDDDFNPSGDFGAEDVEWVDRPESAAAPGAAALAELGRDELAVTPAQRRAATFRISRMLPFAAALLVLTASLLWTMRPGKSRPLSHGAMVEFPVFDDEAQNDGTLEQGGLELSGSFFPTVSIDVDDNQEG